MTDITNNGPLCDKCPKREFFSGPYFPVFQLFPVYGKIQENTDSVFGHFSRSGRVAMESLFRAALPNISMCFMNMLMIIYSFSPCFL